MFKDIKVSVICNAFNHEPYIRDALEGFIKQKTSFAYEVLIHDDASTDNTAEIIREYERKSPDLIKPVYQTENQYSKGVNIVKTFHLPRLKGKYVAFCEGDDYWTDSLKLQKQYDAMERHPEVDICAHSVTKIRASDGKVLNKIAPSKKETVFDLGAVILGGGGFVATNSLFYRRSLLDNEPEFRKYCGIDYSLQIHGAMRGGMLYLPDDMAVYRDLVPGSWTTRIKNSDFGDKQRVKMETMLDMVNEETNGQYDEIIYQAKMNLAFASYEAIGDFKKLRSGELRNIYIKKKLSWKIKARIKEFAPWLLKLHKGEK